MNNFNLTIFHKLPNIVISNMNMSTSIRRRLIYIGGPGTCFLCAGQHKLAACKFLPICQEVIKSVKERVEDSQSSKMKKVIAAAVATTMDDGKVQPDFTVSLLTNSIDLVFLS